MAIFTSSNQHSDIPVKSGPSTIIAHNTKVVGQIHTNCHLHIDGEFEGEIHSKNTVMIGKSGLVKGNIESQKLIVNGKFSGEIKSNILEILPQGCIEGKVVTQEFVIERKGLFIGESKINAREEVKEADKK